MPVKVNHKFKGNKMTLTDELINFMKKLDSRGVNLSKTPNTTILMQFYTEEKGMPKVITLTAYLWQVKERKLPAYASVTRAIRKARELTPRWRKVKAIKAAEIAETKEEVGY